MSEQMIKLFNDFLKVSEKEWRLKLDIKTINSLAEIVEKNNGVVHLVKMGDSFPERESSIDMVIYDSNSSVKSIVLRK